MPTARRLNHVHILVRDLERSIRFYTEAFGLRKMYRDEVDDEVLAFLWTPGKDPDVLTLHGSDSESAGDPGGVQHFGFQVPGQLDETIMAVEVNGGTFVARAGWEPEYVAYVRDPDGYPIEIDARAR